MTTHDMVSIIGAACHTYEAGLPVLPHGQAIDVEGGRAVLPQHTVLEEAIELLATSGVDVGAVRIGAGRKVDLGFADSEETSRPMLGQIASLFGGHDVIGQFTDGSSLIRYRAQGFERFEDCHRCSAAP